MLVLIILVFCAFLYILHLVFYYAVYDKHRRIIKCESNVDMGTFCDMAVIRPPRLSEQSTDVVIAYCQDKSNGKRTVISDKKAGRTIGLAEITKDLPELIKHSQDVAAFISEKFDMVVHPLLGVSPLAILLLIYEDENDQVSWHYDVNVYKGKHFTVVEPLIGFDTCTQFEYIDEHGRVVVQPLKEGEAVMLQGDVLFHRASRQCQGHFRVAVAMEFATILEKDPWKSAVDLVKQRFF